MIKQLPDTAQLKKLRHLINESERIVILGHMSPDGDAIGSTTALQQLLARLGKDARVIVPDMMLGTLRNLPGAKEVIDATKYPEFACSLIAEAQLIICLDFNEPKRIDTLAEPLLESKASKVLIDHHLNPGDFADVIISHPEDCATSFLLFKVICALELFTYIDKQIAECLLTGMMTDTGNFSYNCSDPDIYIVESELVRLGADKPRIFREQFATHSLNAIRLNAFALSEKMEVFEDFGAAVIYLTREELNRYHYTKGDTEGLVNKPLEIPSVIYSAFLREEDGYVKVSMRSKGSFPVNELCKEHFGGGGHLNAAGGEFVGTLDQALSLFKSLLSTNRQLYLGNH